MALQGPSNFSFHGSECVWCDHDGERQREGDRGHQLGAGTQQALCWGKPWVLVLRSPHLLLLESSRYNICSRFFFMLCQQEYILVDVSTKSFVRHRSAMDRCGLGVRQACDQTLTLSRLAGHSGKAMEPQFPHLCVYCAPSCLGSFSSSSPLFSSFSGRTPLQARVTRTPREI